MARIRSVKPEHWNDKELPNISLQAHLLWIGMWNFSDDDGIIEADPLLIRSQVFPRRTDIRTEQLEQWLGQLVTARFVIPFEYNGSGYYIHRTFKAHQKIEKSKPSKIPKELICSVLSKISDPSPTRPRLLPDESPTPPPPVGAGEDRKGEGEEGRGEEGQSPPSDFLGEVIFNIQEELIKNQIRFEAICINAKKTKEVASDSLRKYHLYLLDKEQYPKAKKAAFAGFEKWLMNEKNYSNGTTHRNGSQSATAGGQDPTRIGREGIGKL